MKDKNGWLPIETAPSDVELLLFCPERGQTNHARIELDFYLCTKSKSFHAWATHWQPLPLPPIEE